MKNPKLLKVILVMILFFSFIISFVYSMYMFILPKEKMNVLDTLTFLEVVNKYVCRVESVVDDDYRSDNYYVTVKDSCSAEIGYRVFSDLHDEEMFYNKIVGQMSSDSKVHFNASIDVFGYDFDFNSISGNTYQAAVRNKNTVLYVSSDIENKDIAVNILKDAGYFYEVNNDNLVLFLIPGGCFIMFVGSLIWVLVTEIKKKNS